MEPGERPGEAGCVVLKEARERGAWPQRRGVRAGHGRRVGALEREEEGDGAAWTWSIGHVRLTGGAGGKGGEEVVQWTECAEGFKWRGPQPAHSNLAGGNPTRSDA